MVEEKATRLDLLIFKQFPYKLLCEIQKGDNI